MRTAKLDVSIPDDFPTARVIIVEPTAEDFTLLPGDTFTITVESENNESHFIVHSAGNRIHVYYEGESYVISDGDRKLECGHNRNYWSPEFGQLPNIFLERKKKPWWRFW
jgi:hypothetical protein